MAAKMMLIRTVSFNGADGSVQTAAEGASRPGVMIRFAKGRLSDEGIDYFVRSKTVTFQRLNLGGTLGV